MAMPKSEEEMNPPVEKQDGRKEWKRLFNYHWMVRNLSFFLFLAFLAVLYIYNGHYAETTIKNINKTAKDLKEMQYEFKTVKSELMFKSKQSELVKAVEPLGLHEITSPPQRIGDSTLKK
jgi:hypothetical protein